jgi:hypothetical protein
MRFLGFELNDTEQLPYVRVARARIAAAQSMPAAPDIRYRPPKPKEETPEPESPQLGLFGMGGS